MKFKVLATAALAVTLIAGTTGGTRADDRELFGTVVGAAAGGYVGSNIGSGDGQLAATAAGTLIGAVVGSNVTRAGVYQPTGRRYRVRYPRAEPVRAAPRARRQVVIVKHVYPDDDPRYAKGHKLRMKTERKRQWRHRWKREKHRRKLARACYDQPRRCARAF